MRHHILLPILATLVTAVACTESVTAPRESLAPVLGRNSTSTTVPLTFEIVSGFAGDGSGAYIHGACGVRSLLHGSGEGDATLGPSLDWSKLSRSAKQACGNTPRVLHLPQAVSGTVTNLAIYDLGLVVASFPDSPGASGRVGQAGMNTTSACGLITYGIDTDRLVITRLADVDDVDDKRAWRVETTGAGTARCTSSGGTVSAPFSVIVREKP